MHSCSLQVSCNPSEKIDPYLINTMKCDKFSKVACTEYTGSTEKEATYSD